MGGGFLKSSQEIKTISYVHVGGKLVNTADLEDEQRKRLGTLLKTTYFNALYQGRAVFKPAENRE